jgi:hypothetical protein
MHPLLDPKPVPLALGLSLQHAPELGVVHEDGLQPKEGILELLLWVPEFLRISTLN